MALRISPLWWPALAAAAPALAPWLYIKNRAFQSNRRRAAARNRQRLGAAAPLDLPVLEHLELRVLVEWETESGFLGDAAVSYLLTSEHGTLLYDVGFGPTRPALVHNAERIGFDIDAVDALAISHLHCDHIGGLAAQRHRRVNVPAALRPSAPVPCFLPDTAAAPGFSAEIVTRPRVLAAGIGTTGPLACSLFMFGDTEEQALVARVRDKGLMVFTGCGHPTLPVILAMVRRLAGGPIHVIGGGLHFPVANGRGNRMGIQFQRLLGTGKPPWERIDEEDLAVAIERLNVAGPREVWLSAHDTCDHAIGCLRKGLDARVRVLRAGATYTF